MRSMLFLGMLPLALLIWAVLWPWAKSPAPPTALDFETLRQADPIALELVKMRDGYDLPMRSLSGPAGAPLIVMIHGSAWHGMQFEGLAANLPADIVIPDLRGHGVAPVRRGDVDYIGQLEDDIAALPPFLLLVGADNAAFVAESYAPMMQPLTDKGQYHIIPDAGHLALVDHPQTVAAITGWMQNVD